MRTWGWRWGVLWWHQENSPICRHRVVKEWPGDLNMQVQGTKDSDRRSLISPKIWHEHFYIFLMVKAAMEWDSVKETSPIRNQKKDRFMGSSSKNCGASPLTPQHVRSSRPPQPEDHVFLGTSFSARVIEGILKKDEVDLRRIENWFIKVESHDASYFLSKLLSLLEITTFSDVIIFHQQRHSHGIRRDSDARFQECLKTPCIWLPVGTSNIPCQAGSYW